MSAVTKIKFFGRKSLGQTAIRKRFATAADSLIDAGLAGKLPAAALNQRSRHRPQRGEQGITRAAAQKLPPARAASLVGFVHGAKMKGSGPKKSTNRLPL